MECSQNATDRETAAKAPPSAGTIVAVLRRSRLLGADLDLTRPREHGRNNEI